MLRLLIILIFGLGPMVLSSQVQEDVLVYDTFDAFEEAWLKKADGQVYVVNFWATWCKPCVAELPYFEQLHLDSEIDVKVVLVSIDFKEDMEDKVYPFLKKHKLQSQVVLLTDSKFNNWIDRVDPKWSGAIPITLIYTEGTRLFLEKEFHSYQELVDLVASFK